MSYRTETALACAPGVIFGELDSGGMVIDRNSGEYVPADQILRDPLHLDQLDVFKEDHLGCLRFGLTNDDIDALSSDIDALSSDGEEERSGEQDAGPVAHFLNEQEELTALIVAQEADMDMAHETCTKGRHKGFGTDKLDGGRLYRSRSHGDRGRQIYKDRRLREKGSGKTKAQNPA